MFLVCVVPQVMLTLGAILAASDPVTGLSNEAADIPRYLAMSALAAGLLTAVAAVIAAWTPRRAYATAGIIAVFIVPPIVVAVVAELSAGDAARLLLFLSVADILEGLNAAIFETISSSPPVMAANFPGWVYVAAAVAGIAGGAALVLRRYQGVSV